MRNKEIFWLRLAVVVGLGLLLLIFILIDKNSEEESSGVPPIIVTANDSENIPSSSGGDSTEIIEEIPAYNGNPWVAVNGNVPYFTDSEITTDSFESYSNLDALGRCGVCWACIEEDLMPEAGETRGDISSVKPSGWVNAKYDFVSGGYVYNRCHLIGWQLTAENANKENLITGTRYLNIDGMLPFENLVADYVLETGNHVMYRVTPDFYEDELVCRGVMMEGYSVEDNGEGISYCVYCYNVQPGVKINYVTGETKAE